MAKGQMINPDKWAKCEEVFFFTSSLDYLFFLGVTPDQNVLLLSAVRRNF